LRKKTELEKSNFRYNVITTAVYLVGIVLLVQLFNLQIVNGAEYRETSNTRLSRETGIKAARGSILDRTGNILVSTDMQFSLEIYKTKVEDNLLNSSILLITNVLESNGDSYVDPFPIKIEPFEFLFTSKEDLSAWKSKYKIPEAASAEEAFYIFRDKYKIQNENVKEIRQILAVRYAITVTGYSTTRSIQISNNISRNSAVQLQEQGQSLTGANIVIQPIRVYHMGNLASHTIGYMGRISNYNKEEFEKREDTYEYDVDAKVGQTGIEKVFEEYLRGVDGIKQVDMDVDGTVTGEYTSQEAIGGASIVLTIDANLQKIAEQALIDNIWKIKEGGFGQVYDANGGTVVVTNVRTGEILAMASYPDYEPALFYNGISQEKYNEYNNRYTTPLINRAIQGTYEPGSVFKMVTAIAALEEGVTNTTERINDNGKFPLNGVPWERLPACWLFNSYGYGHGWQNVSQAIEHSCNMFFFTVSERLGIGRLAKYASFFGLGRKTGIELDGEKTGTLADEKTFEERGYTGSTGQLVYASIGQGINSFTPVQVAKYISMLANGGSKLDLTIVKSVVQSNGTQIAKSEINEFVKNKLNILEDTSEDLALNYDNLKTVWGGMRSVTGDVGGTAYSVFRDFNIEVGGKTGSAEALYNDWINAWFVGYAPFDNPEIAVVVMVENGGHGFYTAEVVREIIKEYFGMNVQNIVEDMSMSSETEKFI